MNKWDLRPYQGPLSLKEIARGFKLCTQNAESLLDAAEGLASKGSYGYACALVLLSEEEIAKSLMLATAVTLDESDEKSWRRFWSDFRKHKAKQDDLLLFDFFACESVTAEDTFKEMKSGILERLKQLGIYVDNLDGSFVSPKTLFSNKVAKKFVEVELNLARNRLKHMKKINEKVDVRILEKVKKHVKDEKPKSVKEMLKQYHQMIEDLG